jgi:hypothetical protein
MALRPVDGYGLVSFAIDLAQFMFWKARRKG